MDRENIEAIYPLPAAHQPMLFHSLRHGAVGKTAAGQVTARQSGDPAAERAFLQYGSTFRVESDADGFPDALRRAWAYVIERHGALRTSFHWVDLDQPLQVVARHVELRWHEHDWRGKTEHEARAERQKLLADERAKGLDLTQAPVMQVTLLRLSDDSFRHQWSFHHLLMDGWSAFLVLGDLFAAVDKIRRGEALPALTAETQPRPYRDYVTWLGQRNADAAATFWGEYLSGLDGPTSLARIAHPATGGQGASVIEHAMKRVALSAETTEALQQFARAERVTVNTLCQATWGALLAHYASAPESSFGTTVSGRPAAIPGVESIVGLFTNAVPVRVRLRDDHAVGEWLREAQAEQVRMREFEYAPAADIQEWSEVPSHLPLFESLFLFQNYPWDGSLGDGCRDLSAEDFEWDNTTNFPLTAVAIVEETLELHVHYDTTRFAADVVDALLEDWEGLLAKVVIAKSVGDLPKPEAALRAFAATPPPETTTASTSTSPAQAASAAGGFVGPRNEVERLVSAIWCDTLGLDRINVIDNFFDVGGTSLLLMKSVTKLERATGLKINAWEFVFQTLEQVAAVLAPRIEANGGLAPDALEPKGLKGRLFRTLGRAVKRKR